MFSNLLFTMSMTGSIVFLLYLLTYPLTKRYFSIKWRYMILKIAAAFYLLPVPMCKDFILDVIHCFFPVVWEKNSHISEMMDTEYIIIKGSDFAGVSSGSMHMLFTLLFLGIISFVIIQRRMFQYWKWKVICSLGFEGPKDWERKLFKKVKKETGIKKDVEFICSGHCSSPMVSGVLSSVLVFPVWKMGWRRINMNIY